MIYEDAIVIVVAMAHAHAECLEKQGLKEGPPNIRDACEVVRRRQKLMLMTHGEYPSPQLAAKHPDLIQAYHEL